MNELLIEGILDKYPEKAYSVGGKNFYEGIAKVARLSKVYDEVPFTVSEKILDILKNAVNVFL